jgi:hypothetical protein
VKMKGFERGAVAESGLEVLHGLVDLVALYE